MASQVLTDSPVALTGTSSDTRYTLQNRSPWTVYVDIASSEPTGSDDANVMRPSGITSIATVEHSAGESIWVWASGETRRGSGKVIYREAP